MQGRYSEKDLVVLYHDKNKIRNLRLIKFKEDHNDLEINVQDGTWTYNGTSSAIGEGRPNEEIIGVYDFRDIFHQIDDFGKAYLRGEIH